MLLIYDSRSPKNVMCEIQHITNIRQFQQSFKGFLDGLSVSLDLPPTFGERFGFEPFTISSLSREDIGRGKGALFWRDVKKFIELFAGSEDAAKSIVHAMYPESQEDSDAESESSSDPDSDSSSSETESDSPIVYKPF